MTWWRRRNERQKQVTRDADNLVALFGDGAYSEALARVRHEDDAGGDPGHWLAVRREIAKRTGKHIGLDTGTRYSRRLVAAFPRVNPNYAPRLPTGTDALFCPRHAHHP